MTIRHKLSVSPRLLLDNTPLVLTFLLLFDSMHHIFARLLRPYMPAVVSAFYVLAIAAVEFAIIVAWRQRIRWRVLLDHFWFFFVIGLLVGGATWMSYQSINYVDAGTASLLARSTTIFSIGLGLVWLRDRLNRWEWLGTAVALIGVVTISFQPGDVFRLGSLFVLSSSFIYALHAAVVKRYGGEIDFLNFFLFRVGMTAVVLFFFMIGQGSAMLPPEPAAWGILLLAASIDVVISRVLYYWALRQLTMSYHAIILMLSPVVTILWSLLLFFEYPTLQGILGGAAVILGLAIVNWQRT